MRGVEWVVGAAVVGVCVASGWIVVDMFRREEGARIAAIEADNAGIPEDQRPRLVRDPERHAAQDQLVSLFGDVERAGYYELPAAGGMTLGRMLQSAGGVREGAAGDLSLIRRSGGTMSEVFRGRIESLGGEPARSTPVLPGDVIRVPG